MEKIIKGMGKIEFGRFHNNENKIISSLDESPIRGSKKIQTISSVKLKEYFKVLSDEIPDFLYDYINTKPMQRIGKIGCGCGTDYTKIFNNKFFYSNLDFH